MAPEFAMEGLYSIKSDVFSFGVLLLEIITGTRNAGFHRTKLGPSLVAYVIYDHFFLYTNLMMMKQKYKKMCIVPINILNDPFCRLGDYGTKARRKN